MDMEFETAFKMIMDQPPLRWQRRLYTEYFNTGNIPRALDLLTGFGKTSVIPIWFIARMNKAKLPNRLFYVVNRRAVVDQATRLADRIKEVFPNEVNVSTLRGQYVDNRNWLKDPCEPAIVLATPDMLGSRLLFSGYGVTPRMRPYHAGLSGCDSLIALDESHLIPSFQVLLETIESDFRSPMQETVPPMKVLSLSATGKNTEGAFQLDGEDMKDEFIRKRLNATKQLKIVPHKTGKKGFKNLTESMVTTALKLATEYGKPIRCVLFCDFRQDAETVAEKIKAEVMDTAEVELLVGGRRVLERKKSEDRLEELGFLGGNRYEKNVFLVATSAGEVGVDIDSDVMVGDVVEFERMIQRLGRVNRRGGADSKIVLLHDSKTANKKHKSVVELLQTHFKDEGDTYDVSLKALKTFNESANQDVDLAERIKQASSEENYRPVLTQAHVDMWALTTMGERIDKSDVKYWIRGWTKEEPLVKVVWRKHLPVKDDGSIGAEDEVKRFFSEAPIHLSEQLEERTYFVADWLVKRAEHLKSDSDISKQKMVVVLNPDGSYRNSYSISELVGQTRWEKSKIKGADKNFTENLNAGTLVVDSRFGGLSYGLLSSESGEIQTADDGSNWLPDNDDGNPAVGFEVIRSEEFDEAATYCFPVKESEDEVHEYISVHSYFREENRSHKKSVQTLADHEQRIVEIIVESCEGLALKGEIKEVLSLVCLLHDRGKKARNWQQGMNAPKEGGPYAKTKGPMNRQLIGGYRHELGSLLEVEAERDIESEIIERIEKLEEDMKDLLLHLIASHHGSSRPIIETKSCGEYALPSQLDGKVVEIMNRYVRLQEKWGAWGLAWLESLVRSADQKASRELENVNECE